MMTIKNKRLVLAERPEALIRTTNFRIEEVNVPDLREGEFLIQTQFLSVAPVMKFYMTDGAGIEMKLEIGDLMRGRGVGKIIVSRNDKFKSGDIVQGKFGWQEYVIGNDDPNRMMYKVNTHGLSSSTALGVLGMTGFTSYFGLYDVGQLKQGDNVLVSSAAGGVGSIIGSLAKIKGARVIGMTSTQEKCDLLVNKLNYDGAINYKKGDLSENIKTHFPDGIDLYFDNVGGEILDASLAFINRYAKVVCCGRISTYKDNNLLKQEYLLKNWHMIGAKRARMEGFFIYDYEPQFPKAAKEMSEWIKEGKLTFQEDILEGLENMPVALSRLFEGKNVGKQLVKISTE